MNAKNPWKTLTSSKIYSNPWIDLYHNEVITPGGNEGIYGKVHYKNRAVGVVPIDKDGFTYLVGQYRYTLDIYSWEIPEGGSPFDEDLLVTAKRELKEETGLVAQNYSLIMELHTSNAVCDEVAYLYLATDLEQQEAEPEDTEELIVKRLPFSEVVSMVHLGKITDAMSVAAILKVDWLLRNKQVTS